MIELQKKFKYISSLDTSLLTVGVHAVLHTYTVKLFESNFEMVQKLSRSEEGAVVNRSEIRRWKLRNL